jgi:2-oxoisovalerate ferredoxin oxidoreductase alpha subunit
MTKFVKGNEAVVIGALYAGCDLYFGYPITPASEIAHGAAKWFPMLGRKFVQAECETASVNMMFGAAGAGKLCMTATSGPGFSLMQEGLSYLAGAELPSVVVNINRAGPGLGNVYPEQSDYIPAVKGGGHGSYQTFTLAPASAQEMCDLTVKAFEMAAKWRTPAVVYADGLQGQMMEPVKLPDAESPRPDFSAWAAQGEAKTRTNLVKSIYLDAAQQEAFNRHLQEK